MLRTQKTEFRESYMAKRRELDGETRRFRDRELCKNVCSMVSFRFAEYILMYAPVGEEIDVNPIAIRALEMGKRVFYPVCDAKNYTMSFGEVTSLEELSPGTYKIPEPTDARCFFQPDRDTNSALCLIPGVVYDREGYRIGYGKGFYDRFLTDFKGCRAGIIYSDFIVPSLPRGRFDTKADILLTEKGAVMTGAK